MQVSQAERISAKLGWYSPRSRVRDITPLGCELTIKVAKKVDNFSKRNRKTLTQHIGGYDEDG